MPIGAKVRPAAIVPSGEANNPIVLAPLAAALPWLSAVNVTTAAPLCDSVAEPADGISATTGAPSANCPALADWVTLVCESVIWATKL